MSAYKYVPNSNDWLEGIRVGSIVHFRAKGSTDETDSEITMELTRFRYKPNGGAESNVNSRGAYLSDDLARRNIAADASQLEMLLDFKGAEAFTADWGRDASSPLMFGMTDYPGMWVKGYINQATDDNMGMAGAQLSNLFSRNGWVQTTDDWIAVADSAFDVWFTHQLAPSNYSSITFVPRVLYAHISDAAAAEAAAAWAEPLLSRTTRVFVSATPLPWATLLRVKVAWEDFCLHALPLRSFFNTSRLKKARPGQVAALWLC